MKYLCFVTLALLLDGVASDVSCSSGLYSVGSKGFVRCHFGRVVRQGKLQLLVVHCGNTVCSPTSQRYPLACDIKNGELDCTDALPGYTFVDQVDSSLTLGIPNVTEQTAGAYFCQVNPSDDSPIHNCTLTLTGNDDDERLPSSGIGNHQTACTADDDNVAVIALAIVLVIVLLPAVWAWVVLLLQGRRRHDSPADFCRSLLPCLKNGVKERDAVPAVSDSASNVANRRSQAEMENLLEMVNLDTVSVEPTMLAFANAKHNFTDRQTQTPNCTKYNTETQTLKKENSPVKDWTVDQVREWLMEQAVVKYQKLIDKGVTGAQLPILTLATLKKDMGLTNEADKLKDLINTLMKEDKARQAALKKARSKTQCIRVTHMQ